MGRGRCHDGDHFWHPFDYRLRVELRGLAPQRCNKHGCWKAMRDRPIRMAVGPVGEVTSDTVARDDPGGTWRSPLRCDHRAFIRFAVAILFVSANFGAGHDRNWWPFDPGGLAGLRRAVRSLLPGCKPGCRTLRQPLDCPQDGKTPRTSRHPTSRGRHHRAMAKRGMPSREDLRLSPGFFRGVSAGRRPGGIVGRDRP